MTRCCRDMRVLCVLLAVLATAVSTGAQAPITRGPLPVGAKVVFEIGPNVVTVADALTFEARLSRNGMPLTAATSTSGLTCATAVAPAVGITCQWILTASNRDALNQVGVHSLTLTSFRADVGESPASSPFSLTTPAGAPTGLRITP